ncbi:unnamed protein product [Parnassius apollo]|uniref:(apollo) hypothetical protein n=1 Tax=Parnassius apollo TaxID=110799 RepID=A0A8S3WPA7_PARAO|nr:unnamed protein product [Parnassius apollo]
MPLPRAKNLTENDILQSLNDSEYESNSEEDPFEDNGTDDKYSPNNEREESSSSSSSSCEDEVSVDEDDNEITANETQNDGFAVPPTKIKKKAGALYEAVSNFRSGSKNINRK